jgi:cell division protein FtsN
MVMKQIRQSKISQRVHGGTLLGFMMGLVIGLGVAVVVAIFVTRAPVPFMNKTNKVSERVLEGRANTDVPDPNKSMYGKQRQANPGAAPGSAAPSSNDTPPGSQAPTAAPLPAPAAPPAPAASNDPANNASSGLGGILSKDSPPPPVAAPMPTTQPPSSTSKDPISDAIKGNTASIEDRTSYQLQAGAYRQQEDAESMKAKLSLLGYESRILNAQVNGETLYRVRVGPYKQFEDMNKAKNRLSENKVEVTVIKIKPAN